MRGGFGCSPCCTTPTGCTTKTLAGYDGYLQSKSPEPTDMLAARVGPFASLFSITSVTILTDGLTYSINPSTDVFRHTPLIELWSHDTASNLPKLLNVIGGTGDPDILATFTSPASFPAGNWVFTHTGYTISAETYYWIVLNYNGRWGFWDENCATQTSYASYEACEAACCDYWADGRRQLDERSSWDGANLCGGYVLSIN